MSGFQELKEDKSNAQVAKTENGTRLVRKPVLKQEDVRELFDYDPETGIVYNRVHRQWKAKIGDEAGTIHSSNGYKVVGIYGRRYLLHRIIWLYVYGYFPEGMIDHINRVRTDNRLCNLREISETCSVRNTGNRSNCKSGVKGVCKETASGNWISFITVNYRRIRLKETSDFIEAVAYRLAAEQCVGWSGCDDSSPAYQFMQSYLKEVKC